MLTVVCDSYDACGSASCEKVPGRRQEPQGSSSLMSRIAGAVIAGVAQLAEQVICNHQVVGWNPTPGSRS